MARGGSVVMGWIRSGLDFFGGAGNLVLAIVGLLLTPFVDRMLIRRKRLGYRVLYNSKIGLDFGGLLDDPDPVGAGSGPARPPGAQPQPQAQAVPATPAPATQLYRLSRLLDRMSIVVIRIRNNGSHHIGPEDFEQPLSFTFGRRMVWNARISEGGSREEEERLRASLRFFRNDADRTAGHTDRDNLRTVRDRFVQRMSRLIGASTSALDDGAGDPTWHGVRLESLALRRRQRFKLVVVLREPDSGDGDGNGGGGKISKDYHHGGKLRENGLIKDEGEERRLSLQRVTGGLAALLTVLLVFALAFAPKPADSSIACASGQVRIVGSTVFVPTVSKI